MGGLQLLPHLHPLLPDQPATPSPKTTLLFPRIKQSVLQND